MSTPEMASLAGNLRAVWGAPSTDGKLKKHTVRTVIHEVIAELNDVPPRSSSQSTGLAVSIRNCASRSGIAAKETLRPTTSSRRYGSLPSLPMMM
ncbi:hypothetical protein AM571_PA00351 (plasmid) [Rhizobium etli 8C-3]|uniref:Uncharacterized protein n=1 Tax=Rhizobium etli 8C-3 TaxID=538025 RepID=A0A1L5PAM1_RHIET|nr:hypothetical protein AM571_PA00351 [Rhizobium etli 8C-3]